MRVAGGQRHRSNDRGRRTGTTPPSPVGRANRAAESAVRTRPMPWHIRRVPRLRGSVLWAPARGSMSPIDEPCVPSELTRYLEEQWIPVIERDVDGEHSLPFGPR